MNSSRLDTRRSDDRGPDGAGAPSSPHPGIAAGYIASGWSALLGIAFVPSYVYYLGIESYGLVGFFAILSAWLAILDLGMGATLSREVSMYMVGARALQGLRDLLRSLEIVYALTAFLISAAVAAVSHLIATHWLGSSSLPAQTVSVSIAIMGLLIAAQGFGTLYRGAVLGLQHQVWLSTCSAVAATIRSVGCLLVLMWSPTLIAFFSFQVLVIAAEAFAMAAHLHRQLPTSTVRPKFSFQSIAQVSRFAGGLSLIGLSAVLLTQVDKMLLSRLLPLDQFGYFVLVTTVAGTMSLLVTPLHNVAYPRLSGIASSGDQHKFAVEYHKFAQILSIGTFPVGLLLALFPAEVITVWMGDPDMGVKLAPVLSIWALGTSLNCLTHVPHIAQLAHAWTKLGTVMSFLMVSVSVPLLLLLVPRYGAMAAAWIWVGVNAGYLVIAIPIMHSRILREEQWEWCTRDVLFPLLSGTLVAALLKMLSPSGDRLHTAVFLFGTGFLVFLAVFLACRMGRQAAGASMKGIGWLHR